MATLLFAWVEEINALGPEGQNALHFAAKQGHEKSIRLIVSAQGDVEAESSDGERPLSIAAQFGALDSVRVLVELGADVEVGQAGKLNHRPLHEAAKRGHETVVKALLELGAACSRSPSGARRWCETLHNSRTPSRNAGSHASCHFESVR
jgi:ankyrin repeat protein